METSSSATSEPKRFDMCSTCKPGASSGLACGSGGNSGSITLLQTAGDYPAHDYPAHSARWKSEIRKSGKSFDQLAAGGGGAEHTVLHFDHLDGGEMIAGVRCGAAILKKKAFKATIIGFPHGGVNAHIRRDAGENNILDIPVSQEEFEVRG